MGWGWGGGGGGGVVEKEPFTYMLAWMQQSTRITADKNSTEQNTFIIFDFILKSAAANANQVKMKALC